MRCLITGGAGFIGSNLVRYLLGRGHEVLNVDALTYAGNLGSLEDLGSLPKYRFVQADIATDGRLFGWLQDFAPDCVMLLATESHVDRSLISKRVDTQLLFPRGRWNHRSGWQG